MYRMYKCREAHGCARAAGGCVREAAGGVGFGGHGKVVADGRAQGTLMKLILVIPNRH